MPLAWVGCIGTPIQVSHKATGVVWDVVGVFLTKDFIQNNRSWNELSAINYNFLSISFFKQVD